MGGESPFKHTTIEANQVIFDDGDPAESVYVLKSGAVEIRTGTRGDNPQILATIHEGEVFGELALLENRSHQAAAVTVEKCEIVKVTHKEFINRLNASDPIMKTVVNHLVLRLREVTSEPERRSDIPWAGWHRK